MKFLATVVACLAIGGVTKVTPPVKSVAAAPLEPFVQQGVDWLIKAQHPDGGWGAGSHANQQLRDPHQVVTDPATTAFVAMALVRSGSTPVAGPQQAALKRATLYLLDAVERAAEAGPQITNIQGTQPQAKLGPLVDTGLTSQYLARVLPTLAVGSPLHGRVDKALDKCLRKLQGSQLADGSWGTGRGWAPVLQSSVSTSALEMAQAAGKVVEADKLDRARAYQKGNYAASPAPGGAAGGMAGAAGVELYALTSAQRAGAREAAEAAKLMQEAKDQGRLPASAPTTEENLKKAGADAKRAQALNDAYNARNAQLRRLSDEELLRGFGSNGGEEYLSYLQTSESLVIAGGKEWDAWKSKMSARMSKIQSQDGSWTGHHCITSPVFCTAAVLQTLTADRDAGELRRTTHVAQRR
jgi:squalene-hopene cyclase-like protein